MAVLTRFHNLYKDLATIELADLDGVYHKNIVFDDPVTSHKGIKAVKEYFANLLENASSCEFTIHNTLNCQGQDDSVDHVVIWTMKLQTSGLNKGNPVYLDGTSMLKIEDDRVIHHRDYYDMGQMVYEHIPLLGFFIRKIKQRLIG